MAIAEAFHQCRSRVILCGRDRRKLSAVEQRFPGITALPCNVGDGRQRKKLAAEVMRHFADLDILINNAGIQRYIDLKKGYGELKSGEDEIAINFVSAGELTALFNGQLMSRMLAAVTNVSSGLGFMRMLNTPAYSATKAAIHTYTFVLRQQLKNTSVRVIEIVPPLVDTGLNREGRGAVRLKFRGISLSQYISTVMRGLKNDAEIIFQGDGAKVLTEPRGESKSRLLKSSS